MLPTVVGTCGWRRGGGFGFEREGGMSEAGSGQTRPAEVEAAEVEAAQAESAQAELAPPVRPEWAEGSDLLRDYYDTEWGFPVRDARGVFERIVLEGFQSGLSWSTVLRKRPAFRAAFAGFDPAVVAAFDERDVERLMGDSGIIRNRRKIEAAITNARAVLALEADGVDLGELVWSFEPDAASTARDSLRPETTSPESLALSKELKRRGFTFVGPVTMYALMEAIGIIDHRLPEPSRG